MSIVPESPHRLDVCANECHGFGAEESCPDPQTCPYQQASKSARAWYDTRLTIADLQEQSYRNSRNKGFWNDVDNIERFLGPGFVYKYVIPTKLDLIVSELSEALENVRDGTLEAGKDMWYNELGKPEGFSTELADAIIRILDLAGFLGIDMEHVIREKERYNLSRPFMHGGKSI